MHVLQLNGRSSDWKVPGWEVAQPGGTAQQLGTSLALAAPHPIPGLPSTAATNGAAPHPPPDSDGVPSIDGDAGEPCIHREGHLKSLVLPLSAVNPWTLCGPQLLEQMRLAAEHQLLASQHACL